MVKFLFFKQSVFYVVLAPISFAFTPVPLWLEQMLQIQLLTVNFNSAALYLKGFTNLCTMALHYKNY